MNDLSYLFSVVAGIVIIPVTSWLKQKLPNVSFLPPILALILALIAVFAMNSFLKLNQTPKDLILLACGIQFLSQLGYEIKKNGKTNGSNPT